MIVLFGYIVPAVVLAGVVGQRWMGIFPRLANDSLMATLGIAVGR